MKIISASRVENDITICLEDGTEVLLDWTYILALKPQLEDEYTPEALQVTE